MKKTLRTTIILLIAIMTLAIATVSASAAGATVTRVDIKKASTTLAPGKSEGLSIHFGYTGAKPTSKDFTWTSSNTKVATVSGGTIKAVKPGTATITVSANGHKDTCKVTVKTTARWISASDAYTQLNNRRKNAKVAALKKDANLEKIAKIRAEEMAKNNKFSHTRPNGKSGLTLIKGNLHKGENIAKGQKTGKEVTQAWYNSAGHRRNMLRKEFKKVGIACFEYNGVTYWAQVFSS